MVMALLKQLFASAANHKLVTACIVLLFLSFVVAINLDYLGSCFFPPRNITGEELGSMTDVSSLRRKYVHVSGSRLIPAAALWYQNTYDRTTGKTESTDTARALNILCVGRKLLAVRVNELTKATDYTGFLRPMPAELKTYLSGSANPDSFIPLLFDATINPQDFYIPIGMGVIAFGWSAFQLLKGLTGRKGSDSPISNSAKS
jgi:hypothetical protein